MKWEYDLETLRELSAKEAALTGDVIEALRAIAEQLESIKHTLVIIAKLKVEGIDDDVFDAVVVEPGSGENEQ